MSKEIWNDVDWFIEQNKFIPLSIVGLLDHDRYLINERGFVFDKWQMKKNSKHLKVIMPKIDKELVKYVTLETNKNHKMDMNIDFLFDNNGKIYTHYNWR